MLLKKQNTLDIQEYRPISLIHGFSKILTNLMVALAFFAYLSGTRCAFVRHMSIHKNLQVPNSGNHLHTRKRRPVCFNPPLYHSLTQPLTLNHSSALTVFFFSVRNTGHNTSQHFSNEFIYSSKIYGTSSNLSKLHEYQYISSGVSFLNGSWAKFWKSQPRGKTSQLLFPPLLHTAPPSCIV
jgi:hypothetical protein